MRTAPLLFAACLTVLTVAASPAAVRRAPAPEPKDLTAQFTSGGINLERLQVYEIGGIVLIRGRAYSKSEAETAGKFALSLGYSRVANLIQVVEPPDDVTIVRTAERALTIYGALDGCRFKVDSKLGVVRVDGTVQHDTQKDMAVQIVRNIEGVRQVRAEGLVRE